MDCMRRPYKERVRIIALVLAKLSEFSLSNKELAIQVRVSLSTFKRLSKMVRETETAKSLTPQFKQKAKDLLSISVGDPD